MSELNNVLSAIMLVALVNSTNSNAAILLHQGVAASVSVTVPDNTGLSHTLSADMLLRSGFISNGTVQSEKGDLNGHPAHLMKIIGQNSAKDALFVTIDFDDASIQQTLSQTGTVINATHALASVRHHIIAAAKNARDVQTVLSDTYVNLT